jgi:hypothetical protein
MMFVSKTTLAMRFASQNQPNLGLADRFSGSEAHETISMRTGIAAVNYNLDIQ